MEITIINGPNLNLLGRREPEVYGNTTFEEYMEKLRKKFPALTIHYFQSNVEGELINKLHEIGFGNNAAVINAGGYSHTSVALRDAIKSIPIPVIEVHISNIFAREDFRHHSLLAAVCKGSIIGLGFDGYRLAIENLLSTNL